MVNITDVNTNDALKLKYLTDELLENLRPADLTEMKLLGMDPWKYIYTSMETSDECFRVRDDLGRLIAVGGVSRFICVPLEARNIWFLATTYINGHNKEFVYYGHKKINYYLCKYLRLGNYISRENKPALDYIKHFGAKFHRPVQIGKYGGIFIPFILEYVTR